jgi:membrane-bound metal-dependent hydrolase YbcI (DUF457 family)
VADLVTHIGLAWAAGRAASCFREIPSRAVYLFAAGAALPDLLARAPHLALRSATVRTITVGLHTPACLVFACLFLSFLFEERGRARVFLALFAGSLFHCFTDGFQQAWPGSYHWLYPLAAWSPQVEGYSGRTTVLYAPIILGAALAAEALWRLWRRRRGGADAGRSVGDPLPKYPLAL